MLSCHFPVVLEKPKQLVPAVDVYVLLPAEN